MASFLELQPPANWDVLAHIDWALAHLAGTVEIRNRRETRAINVPKLASISLIWARPTRATRQGRAALPITATQFQPWPA